MRRALSFVVATAMFLGGVYFLYLHLTYGHAIIRRAILLGCILSGVGGAWLWFDFIGPMLGRKGDV